MFTKRSTSIIAANQEIYPHPKFTETLDYEGEVGVIIGKAGFAISPENAMDHVWGYTIINGRSRISRDKIRHDAKYPIRCHREGQTTRPSAILYGKIPRYVLSHGKKPRDIAQILRRENIANNFVQGPVAVSAAALPEDLRIRTFVNGEIRQDGTTSDLITSIPKIIQVISSGITLQPGDVIATGTPHGVGVGFRPPKFLNPGDLGNVLLLSFCNSPLNLTLQ